MNKSNINFVKPPEQQLHNLLEHFQFGRYDDAEKLSLSITLEFPEHQFAWKVLAALLMQTGRLNESLTASKKSVELNPHDYEATYTMSIILQKLGKLDDAETSYRKTNL